MSALFSEDGIAKRIPVPTSRRGLMWDPATSSWSAGEVVPRAPTAGEETMDRHSALSGVPMVSQFMRVTYFQARVTEPITQLLLTTGTSAAAATPTLVRAGVYDVAADWSLSNLRAIDSDTTIFAAVNAEYLRTLTVSVSKAAGNWYAFAILVVTAATAPNVPGAAMSSSALAGSTHNRPRLALGLAGQADLPASVAAGSLVAANSGGACYGLLVP